MVVAIIAIVNADGIDRYESADDGNFTIILYISNTIIRWGRSNGKTIGRYRCADRAECAD